MKEYTVINKQTTLHSGTVKLSDSQAKDRIHNLEPVKNKEGLYKIKASVNFKHGEIFSYDGEVNKTMLEEIGEFVDVKAEKTVGKQDKKEAPVKKDTPVKK